jgi:predicted DNA-binding protein (UPF0278 family)
MDKDLLKLAVELAAAQVKANATISTNDPRGVDYVTQSNMQDVVMEYYDWLKTKNSNA